MSDFIHVVISKTKSAIMKIISTGHHPTEAYAIGSIVDVVAGRLDPKLSKRRFRAADYSFGFEAASPKNPSSIGESLLVNGTCYTTSTDDTSAEYGKVIWGHEFMTGGMFLLPKQALPTHELILTGLTKLEDLYQEIYRKVQRPVAFVGMWESATLYAAIIAKPPIHGLPVFENRDHYFPKPPQILHEKHCFVMGLMACNNDHQWDDLNQQLEVALYKNPYDRESSLTSHTHCLTLKSEMSSENIRPEWVDQCLHVFADQTTLRKGHLNLYALDGIKRL